ncbi:hemophore-related protein [Nocardia sp. NPDC052112]|uniref:hemophore-related protein n=1 Tax=Nocardia sp. NPDC052112 TaxID=3155646 RepID=UPI003416B5DA
MSVLTPTRRDDREILPGGMRWLIFRTSSNAVATGALSRYRMKGVRMRMLDARYPIAALAIGGFAAAAPLFGTGVAAADVLDVMDPLLTSSCSFAQIDAALHEIAPESAARLDNSPLQKGMLKLVFDQPTEQRMAMYEQLSAHRQRIGAGTGLNPGADLVEPEVGTVLHKVSDSCKRY